MNGVLRVAVAGAAVALLGMAAPVGAQEAPTTTVLVTYTSEAGLDRAAAEGGQLDQADDGATAVATRVAVAELTPAEAAAVAAQPGVLAVEPDSPVFLAEAPNDPCYAMPLLCAPSLGSWHVDQIDLPTAWDLTHGAGTTIAVLDSGIQQTPVIGELAGKQVAPEIDATGGSPACSTMGSGLNHGTQVSTMAAANTNNGAAIPGAGWDARILSVRVFAGPNCNGTSLAFLINGVSLALQQGARILNISATTTNSVAMRSVLDDAARVGAVVIAAAGNSGSSDPHAGQGGYPAFYPDVIAVGGTDPGDNRVSTSNFGPWVDIYAPGTQLAGVSRDGSGASISGTSFAAPIVAGVVALMRTVNPSLSPAQISHLLTTTADPVAAGLRVDAAEAVAVAGCGFHASNGAGASPGTSGAINVVIAGADGRPCGRVSPGSDQSWAAIDGGIVGTPDLITVDGTLIMAARGRDGAAYVRSRQPAQPWGPWTGLGGQFTSDLAVVSWGPNRLDLFGRGLDGGLWHTFSNGVGFAPWSSLGGGLATEPDVAAWAANRLDVFTVGLDGAMWHRAWDGATWRPWESIGGGFRSGPGVTSIGNGLVDVAARGLDNQLWVRSWLGAGWSSWAPVGGILVASTELVHTGGGGLVAVGRSLDGRIWTQRRTGGSWLGWTRLP